jgi:acid stress-induced BolA-like protein IbaG/YrbA
MTDMTDTRTNHFAQIDLIAVERDARALRAAVVAEAFRNMTAWVRARLARAPLGRTA